MRILGSILALCTLAGLTAQACTIVLLTDARRVLFCNNEDWSNAKTRIWFVPNADGRRGCAYVGFDDGWGQGGLNSEGLAFDWVAGFKEKWEPDAKQRMAKGNPAQRMLESCATVEEAVAFFQNHQEPSFSVGRILVADRTGSSAVIGAKDGRLHVEKKKGSRVLTLGYRVDLVDKMLAEEPRATLDNAANIMRAVRQEGKYATKYSNVFDLKSAEIFLYRFPDRDDAVKLNLAEELKKGGHFYDIPSLREQLAQERKPLTDAMKNN